MNTNYPYSHLQIMKSPASSPDNPDYLCRIYQNINPDIKYRIEEIFEDPDKWTFTFMEDSEMGMPLARVYWEFSVNSNFGQVALGTWDNSGLEAGKRRQIFNLSDFERVEAFVEKDYQPLVYLHNPPGENGIHYLRLRVLTTALTDFEVEIQVAEDFKVLVKEKEQGTATLFEKVLIIPPDQVREIIEIEVRDTRNAKRGGGKVRFILSDPKPFDWLDMIKA